MVEMSCEEHDRQAASTQFITHTVGRVLGAMELQATPIDTRYLCCPVIHCWCIGTQSCAFIHCWCIEHLASCMAYTCCIWCGTSMLDQVF